MVIMAIMAHQGNNQKLGAEFTRCRFQQLGGAKVWSWAIEYGILAWIERDHRAAMQHRIHKRRCKMHRRLQGV
jgi:hypothetical protein